MPNDEPNKPLESLPTEAEAKVDNTETGAETPPERVEPEADYLSDNTNPYADRTYTVGKGKPPTHSQFKAGQSGNPHRGPNRAPKSFTECLRKEAEKTVKLTVHGEPAVVTRMEAAAAATMMAAMRGNLNAVKHLQKLDGGGYTAEELLRMLDKERKLVSELRDQVFEHEKRRTGVLAVRADDTHPLDGRMRTESSNKVMADVMANPEMLLEYIKSKKEIVRASEDDEPAL